MEPHLQPQASRARVRTVELTRCRFDLLLKGEQVLCRREPRRWSEMQTTSRRRTRRSGQRVYFFARTDSRRSECAVPSRTRRFLPTPAAGRAARRCERAAPTPGPGGRRAPRAGRRAPPARAPRRRRGRAAARCSWPPRPRGRPTPCRSTPAAGRPRAGRSRRRPRPAQPSGPGSRRRRRRLRGPGSRGSGDARSDAGGSGTDPGVGATGTHRVPRGPRPRPCARTSSRPDGQPGYQRQDWRPVDGVGERRDPALRWRAAGARRGRRPRRRRGPPRGGPPRHRTRGGRTPRPARRSR